MNIRFERWMKDSNLKTAELKLLNEAVICYKANAFRAALLLTYIGFIEIVRSRLLQANKPSLVHDGEWENKRREIMNDDTSDKTIFDLLNRADKKYFKLTDTFRTQISYWKDRRNDCAHLKGSEIDSSHVESFWLFIMDNINKISVSDSDTDLLNQFRLHFDDAHTPYNTDVTPLILKMPTSVEICDFYTFLEQFYEVMIIAEEEDPLSVLGEKEKCFFLMLNHLPNNYGEIVKTYISQHDDLNQRMFSWHPEYLTFFSDKPQFIRAAWKKAMAKQASTKTAVALLRNSLIPDGEMSEFIREYVLHNSNNIPKDDDYIFLNQFGYDKKIQELVERALTYKDELEWWINENLRFLKYYLNRNLLLKNNDLIDSIIKKYAGGYRDDKLDKIFSIMGTLRDENPDFRGYIEERVASLELNIDSYFIL